MKVAYGYTVGPNDPFVKVVEESSKISGWAHAWTVACNFASLADTLSSGKFQWNL
jgi:hypothetical protein